MFKFCDGFDSYGSTPDILRKWNSYANGVTWVADGGVNEGGCLHIKSSAASQLWKEFKDNNDEVSYTHHYSFWVKISQAPSISKQFLHHSNGFVSYGWFIDTVGRLCWSSANSTIIEYFSTKNICDNEWHHVEVQIKESTLNGILKLWIDGILEINVSSGTIISTVYQGAGILRFHSIDASVDIFVDDMIIWDNEGTDFNTSPIGVKVIETLRPTEIGDSEQFTRLSGNTNVEMIDDIVPDYDDTYIHSSTSGHLDLYQYEDISNTAYDVTAVVVNNITRMEGGSTTSLIAKAKNGNSVANGTAVEISGTTYRAVQEAFTVDPATSSAWTGDDVNTAQFGIELA